MSLKKKVITGIFWSVLDTWGSRVFSIVIFSLLARLLSPKDFGLIALASVYMEFLSLFVKQGFGEAIIQRDKLEDLHLTTAFWISFGSSILLFLLALFCAGFAASIFKEDLLADIIRWASICLVFGGLSNVQKGIFIRELKFKELTIRSLIASLIGGFLGLIAAVLGFGVWSLVIKVVFQSLFDFILVWHLSLWRPKFEFSLKHFRDLFSYSNNSLGISILSYFYRNFDDMLIGFYLGSVTLGIYSVAYKLLRIFIEVLLSVLGKVTLPMFSKIQNDPQKITKYFFKAISLSSIITLPLFLMTSVLSRQIILLFFGEKWSASIPIMQVLALSGCVYAIKSFNADVIKALGKPRLILIMRLLESLFTCGAFYAAVNHGLLSVAIAFTVMSCAFVPPYMYLAKKIANISFLPYIKNYLIPLCISVFTALVLMAYNKFLIYNVNIYFSLFSSILLGVVLNTMLIFVFTPELIEVEFSALKAKFNR